MYGERFEFFLTEKYVTARNTRRTRNLHKKEIDHLMPFDQTFGHVEKIRIVTYVILGMYK